MICGNIVEIYTPAVTHNHFFFYDSLGLKMWLESFFPRTNKNITLIYCDMLVCFLFLNVIGKVFLFIVLEVPYKFRKCRICKHISYQRSKAYRNNYNFQCSLWKKVFLNHTFLEQVWLERENLLKEYLRFDLALTRWKCWCFFKDGYLLLFFFA